MSTEWTYKNKTKSEWAKLIRRKRRELDITQSQLADLVGTASSTIGHIETCRMFPSSEVLNKILITLKIDEDGV